MVPQHLVGRERGRRDFARLVVTETMHERKKVMFMNADAIVTLPGGPGTLDELFEVLTWRQLGLHAKPVLLLNVGGYWAPLLALLDHILAHDFAEAAFRGYLETVADGENGFRAAAPTPEALATAIHRAREVDSASCRAWGARFGRDAHLARLARVMEEVVQRA